MFSLEVTAKTMNQELYDEMYKARNKQKLELSKKNLAQAERELAKYNNSTVPQINDDDDDDDGWDVFK